MYEISSIKFDQNPHIDFDDIKSNQSLDFDDETCCMKLNEYIFIRKRVFIFSKVVTLLTTPKEMICYFIDWRSNVFQSAFILFFEIHVIQTILVVFVF
jgi:hypothetical protein